MAEKHAPAVDFTPLDDRRIALQETLERPEGQRDLQVRLTVSGGMPSERYDLESEFLGRGDVSCQLETAKEGRLRSERTQLADDEVADVFRRLRLSTLITRDIPMPRIPPDSVVGRLQVSARGEPLTYYFMADPGQARDAGQPPPPELANAVEVLYRICNRLLGDRWVAP